MKRIDTANRAPDLFGPGKAGFKPSVPGQADATYFNARWANHVQEALVRLREAAGEAIPADADYDWFTRSVMSLIEARVADFSSETGTANAKIVAMNPPATAYNANTEVKFRNAVANTNACTIDAGAGARPLVRNDGGALQAGDLPADILVTASYVPVLNKFVISQAVTAQVLSQAVADTRYTRYASISGLPGADIGPITVAEVAEVWIWSASAHFTGYRSPLCGRPVDGHTISPLLSEVDVIGGLVPKAAYARIWGYAKENNLVVTQAVWDANIGAHLFVDVDATFFRLPDLRNMFRRYTGTDADTANARALGSRQLDAFKSHGHANVGGNDGPAGGANTYAGSSSGSTGTTGGAETRPRNTAYAPRIHA